MRDVYPLLGEVRDFKETRLKVRHYLESDFIPLGPCDVDEMLENVTVQRKWDGAHWVRLPNNAH